MRILQLHNYYQHSGGEDQVVSSESKLLREHGHEVRLFSVSNDVVHGLRRKILTGVNVSYSRSAFHEVLAEIDRFRPDVVHVHNFFPLLTPSVYDACRHAGVPVVQTLHNFRTLCAGALLLRNGEICEKCIDGSSWAGVVHRCYRSSLAGSLAVARMIRHHRSTGTWREKIDAIIVLTPFARDKFAAAGFPREKLVVKPNFAADELPPPDVGSQRKGGLFVGRLSVEKGVRTLLEAWKGCGSRLAIAGDGPLMSEVRDDAGACIDVLGRLTREQILSAMDSAAYLVVPSICYEGFPMVVVEAFSRGLPVIASGLGGLAQIVDDRVTGLHVQPGNVEDLVKKIRWAETHPEELAAMGQNARGAYEALYTGPKNYEMLLDIYRSVLKRPAKPGAGR